MCMCVYVCVCACVCVTVSLRKINIFPHFPALPLPCLALRCLACTSPPQVSYSVIHSFLYLTPPPLISHPHLCTLKYLSLRSDRARYRELTSPSHGLCSGTREEGVTGGSGVLLIKSQAGATISSTTMDDAALQAHHHHHYHHHHQHHAANTITSPLTESDTLIFIVFFASLLLSLSLSR